jgi:CotS family spore coat protein
MREDRYKDRKYLSKYDLDVDLFGRFNLEVEDVVPIRKVYIISTNKGNKVLKKIDYDTKELEFIGEIVEHLKHNNFNRTFNFVKTKDGKIFAQWRENIYCVMDLVEGRECQFSNEIDVSIAAKGIAEFHLASNGFKCSLNEKNNCGRIIKKFNKRLQKMRFFKKIVLQYENKNIFDEIFLDNVDYYEEQIKNSIDILEQSLYYNLCEEEDKIVLCHHDLAHHNIFINDNKAYFLDFDYAIIDLKIHDLCNFINKAIKDFGFDMKKAEAIINNYCSINSLDNRELKVLYGMLAFPEDFYSIVRDYYFKKKNWQKEVFIRRLIKKVGYREDREEFLEEIKKIY